MIGICAQSRMGKDTVADIIVTQLKIFQKKSFAEELKLLVSNYFGISLSDIEEYKPQSIHHPNLNMSVRSTLQLIGETFRQVNSNVWVNAAMKNKTKNVIFTDVRHANEIEAILSHEGKLILLGRTKYINMDPHPSESGVKDAIIWFLQNTHENCVKIKKYTDIPEEYQKFSYFIRNDGTMKDLTDSIHCILKDLSYM